MDLSGINSVEYIKTAEKSIDDTLLRFDNEFRTLYNRDWEVKEELEMLRGSGDDGRVRELCTELVAIEQEEMWLGVAQDAINAENQNRKHRLHFTPGDMKVRRSELVRTLSESLGVLASCSRRVNHPLLTSVREQFENLLHGLGGQTPESMTFNPSDQHSRFTKEIQAKIEYKMCQYGSGGVTSVTSMRSLLC